MNIELINLEEPSETHHFEKGRFDVYRVGPATIGRATYEPGWRWSVHVAPTAGTDSCQVEHVGLVLSGQAVARMDDGTSDEGRRPLLCTAQPRQLGRRRRTLCLAPHPRQRGLRNDRSLAARRPVAALRPH